jgi:hypothetical protein
MAYINDTGRRTILSQFFSPTPSVQGWRLWAIRGKEGSVSPVGKHAVVFRVELYKILDYVHEIETKGRTEE